MAKRQSTAMDALTRKATEVERLREFVDSTTFAVGQAPDELSAIDQHPADVADVTMQRELDYTIKQIVQGEAEQIREALHRRAQGRYGVCEACDRPIPRERMRVRPHATLCVACQRKREAGW